MQGAKIKNPAEMRILLVPRLLNKAHPPRSKRLQRNTLRESRHCMGSLREEMQVTTIWAGHGHNEVCSIGQVQSRVKDRDRPRGAG